ncbi:hypothetical protein B0O99DRAFT_597377 [Bisporella sp. PMI_857]|nr:hypothetical protein B0O99DRAFT_597377 [Bisporella sp. PMI_857]
MQQAESLINTYDIPLDQQITTLEVAPSVHNGTPTISLSKEELISTHLNNITILKNAPASEEPRPLMLGAAYAPSIASLNDLQKISFKDLKAEVHHRGCFIAARTITSPYLSSQIVTIIEEEGGDVAKLEVSFQDLASPDSDLPLNSTLAVKEPYFKYIGEGDYAIHVDHPSDIAVLRGDDPAVMMIMEVVSKTKEIGAEEWRSAGDKAFLGRNFSSSIECYTQAIDASPNKESSFVKDVYRKRAYANLTGKRYDVAMEDALVSCSGDPLDHKAYYCAGKAAYELRRYNDARNYFEKALQSNTRDAKYRKDLNRSKTRIAEQEEGTYDFKLMGESLSKSHVHLDHADFLKNTKVEQTKEKGRGLFATTDIKRGDLVLCEKALHFPNLSEISEHQQSIIYNFNTKTRAKSTGQSALFLGLIHKLYSNPLLDSRLFNLDSGEYIRTGKEGQLVDGVPIIDVFLIEAIRLKNGFSYRETYLRDDPASTSKSISEKDLLHAGLWTHAAMLNHSCIPNCSRSFIGDMMILRALCDIPSGTELTHHYTSPEASLFTRQERFKNNWDFECTCLLCATEAKSPKEKHEERLKLMHEIRDEATKHKQGKKVPEATLRSIERLYKKAQSLHEPIIYTTIPRLLLVHPSIWLTQTYHSKRNHLKAVKYAIEILRSFGFGNVLEEEGETRLELDYEKGVVNSEVFNALQYAMDAYRELGKEGLRARCEAEARRMLGIITGDGEGFV